MLGDEGGGKWGELDKSIEGPSVRNAWRAPGRRQEEKYGGGGHQSGYLSLYIK